MRTPGGTWGGGRVAGPWSRINGECVAGVGRGTPWASGMVGRPPLCHLAGHSPSWCAVQAGADGISEVHELTSHR